MKKILLTLLLIAAGAHLVRAQNKDPQPSLLGWDLSYSGVLKQNKIGEVGFLTQWLKQSPESPVKSLLEKWLGEPIISSILLECPAFHAGEHSSMWYVRTEKKAFVRTFIKGKLQSEYTLDSEKYDKIFKQIFAWKQAEPLKLGKPCYDKFSGYFGFLSLYDRGESRQLLLSLEDFYIFDPRNCKDAKIGRVSLFEEISKTENPKK